MAGYGPEMIQVAIIDDHPLARRGVRAILDETGDIVTVLSAASPEDLLEFAPGLVADVILLDLYHGRDEPCLPILAELCAVANVLVVSAAGRPADVLDAIRSGASGYVTKLANPEMLVSAVRTVAAGGFALSSQLADILRSELSGAVVPLAPLSPDEEQVLTLIANGFTQAQAATRMGVSRASVDSYVEQIRGKLQATTTTDS